MIAFAMDPAGQADGRADIGGAQLGAIMRSIGVHGLSLGTRRRFPVHSPFVNPPPPLWATVAMKIHPLISDSAGLAALVERMSTAPFVAVDTEFMRENSFWPELCLIQIASPDEAAAVDPMAEGIDLKPLLDLLVENHEVPKVFHAGGQDLEIVYNLTGKTPVPLFDTQIAAMALGFG